MPNHQHSNARHDDGAVLLGVDLQVDFCPGGALSVPLADQVVPVVNQLARRFRHVVLTQDWHPADHLSFASQHPGRSPFDTMDGPGGRDTLWPDHCVQGSRGAEFHPDLDIPHAEMILRKGFRREVDSYSAFLENDRVTPTGLAGYLRERGLSRVYLAGLALDFCVRFSAQDAYRMGFQVVVIEDACRAIDIGGSLAATRDRLTQLGIACCGSETLRL
jgi:nicotinamidase/pyrazinamidase